MKFINWLTYSTPIKLYRYGIFDKYINVPTKLLKGFINSPSGANHPIGGEYGKFRNYIRRMLKIDMKAGVSVWDNHDNFLLNQYRNHTIAILIP